MGSKIKKSVLIQDNTIAVEKREKCYHCDGYIEYVKDHVSSDITITSKGEGVKVVSRVFHLKCLIDFREKNDDMEYRYVENNDWIEVGDYFRDKLLELPKGSSLGKYAVMRLLGLRVGKYFPKGENVRTLRRGYPFKIMLLTMKLVNVKHMAYIRNTKFKDQKHKVNSVVKIIIDEIDSVYTRYDRQRKSNEKLERTVDEVSTFDYNKGYDNVLRENEKVINLTINEYEVEDDDISIDYENDF